MVKNAVVSFLILSAFVSLEGMENTSRSEPFGLMWPGKSSGPIPNVQPLRKSEGTRRPIEKIRDTSFSDDSKAALVRVMSSGSIRLARKTRERSSSLSSVSNSADELK